MVLSPENDAFLAAVEVYAARLGHEEVPRAIAIVPADSGQYQVVLVRVVNSGRQPHSLVPDRKIITRDKKDVLVKVFHFTRDGLDNIPCFLRQGKESRWILVDPKTLNPQRVDDALVCASFLQLI